MRGELENRTLTVRAGRDDGNVSWVVNGDNDASCEDDLLPVVCVVSIGS